MNNQRPRTAVRGRRQDLDKEHMNSESGNSAENITVRRVWDIVWRRRAALACLCLAVGLAAFCVNYFMLPKRYRSQATILLTKDKTISSGIDLKAVGDLLGNKSFETTDFNYRTVLESRLMADRVFLNPAILGQYKKIKGYDSMERNKFVESQRDFLDLRIENNAIKLSFEGPTPRLAADVVNQYVRQMDLFMRESTTSKRVFLEKELKRLQGMLETNGKEADLAIGPDNKARYADLIRDRMILEQTYAFTYSEYQRTLMDEQRQDKWFAILDRGRVPDKKCHPGTIRSTVLITACTGIICCWIFVVMDLRPRKQQ
jgi:hypothetical protein